MSLEVDVSGGILQCYNDQYTCESFCGFECWTVRTCEHRSTSNYICIPQPRAIILFFVIWCALTVAAIAILAVTCWRILRFRCFGGNKVHSGLIRSVSDLEQRVQVSTLEPGYSAKCCSG